ncbi:MAG TPA: ABC transporter substrate-binding protein [Mycobacteriales bacterium]|jgi:branched-chain amino acid transport system substrate-binding protein|nr:ABC transporter substrate-binding protein [Mycobacteriales bacterium]
MSNDSNEVTRRTLLRGAGAGALLLGGGSALAACGSGGLKGNGSSAGKKITIGLVTPLTGPVASFAVSDTYVTNLIRNTPAFKNGIKIGGKTYPVDIVVKDSQSDPNRASQVAKDLVTSGADMVLTTSTPEVTNPVATVCESEGVPCVATIVPWESWYFGRGAKPGSTFTYTTMFFFGIPEFGECFIPMWNRIHNNKQVALMYPNDADGNAFRDPKTGFPPIMHKAGYKTVDGGAYPDGTTDFTSMISKFKAHDCEIFQNAPIPPDFNAMWKQSAQQGFKPKLATVAKVLLFPSDVTALGNLALNVATDAWWTPFHKQNSSLVSNLSAKQLADNFQSSTGKEWLQSLGTTYSLYEVAHNAFSKVSDPHDRKEVAAQLRSMNYTGMSGTLDFTSGPVPGVAIIKPVGVQWKKGTGQFPFELQVVDNSANKAVPVTADLEPTNA